MNLTSNPWLTALTSDPPAPSPEPAHDDPPQAASGPLAPQLGIPDPAVPDGLPRVHVEAATGLWWVGVHGGAGESTLAALTAGSHAGGHAWPVPLGDTVAPPQIQVALVARTSLSGIRAAQRAATEWALGSLPHLSLLGLVWIADAPGKLPRALRDEAAVVSGGVPRVWHIPWIEAWRTAVAPSIDGSPKQVRRLLQDLRYLVTESHAAPSGPA